MIVTLDSLGSARSPVVGVLKTYLREEANNKKGKVIPEAFNKRQGMSAKGIPTQTNFSDCGIYLIYYLAKFLENPNEFMAKLLAKDFHDEDWCDSKDPSSMREGFREVIYAKYLEHNPTFCKDEATLQTAKTILDTKKIFGGRGKALQPAGPATQSQTGSTTGKLRSVKRTGDSAINKPFVSPVIKRNQPQELAQAPSLEMPNSDDEDTSTAPKTNAIQTPRTQTQQRPEGIAHVCDKLEEDLQDRFPVPETSPRHDASSSRLKRRRSSILKDTPDELGATPDNEHRMDFIQPPSQICNIGIVSSTSPAIVLDENEELLGTEPASSDTSAPTSFVENMESTNHTKNDEDDTSSDDDSATEADETTETTSSLSHRRRPIVVADASEGMEEDINNPAMLLSSNNSPHPSYEGISAQRPTSLNRQAKAMDNQRLLQGLMYYAATDGAGNEDAMDVDDKQDMNDGVHTKEKDDDAMLVDDGED